MDARNWTFASLLLLSCATWCHADDQWLDQRKRQSRLAESVHSVHAVVDIVKLSRSELRSLTVEELIEFADKLERTDSLDSTSLLPILSLQHQQAADGASMPAVEHVNSYWNGARSRVTSRINRIHTEYAADDDFEVTGNHFNGSAMMFNLRRRKFREFSNSVIEPLHLGLPDMAVRFLDTFPSSGTEIEVSSDAVVVKLPPTQVSSACRMLLDPKTGLLLERQQGVFLKLQRFPLKLANGLYCPGRRLDVVCSRREEGVVDTVVWYEFRSISVNDDFDDELELVPAKGDRVHIDNSVQAIVGVRSLVVENRIPDLLDWFRKEKLQQRTTAEASSWQVSTLAAAAAVD